MDNHDMKLDRVDSKSSIARNTDSNNVNYNTLSQKFFHLRSNSLETIWAFDNPTFLPEGLPSSVSGEYGLPPVSNAEVSDYDPHDYGKQDGTSFWGTVFHVYIICAGPIIFTLPAKFLSVGYISGCIGTIAIILLYMYNMKMLTDAQYELCKRKRTPKLSYSDTVYYSFLTGPVATRKLAYSSRIFTHVVFIAIWGGANSANLLLIGDIGKEVYSSITGHQINAPVIIWILFIPILLLCWIPTLKYLIPISVIGNFMNIIAAFIVIYNVFEDPTVHPKPIATSFWKLPIFLGSTLMAINGSAIMLPLKNDMVSPKQFGSLFGVLTLSFIPISIIYVFFEVACVAKYGKDVQGIVLLSLSNDEFLTKIALILFILAICAQFPLISYVVYDIIWNILLKEKHDKLAQKRLWEYTVRTVIVVVTFIGAFVIPNLDVFLSFCGSVGSAIDSIIFPVILNTFMWLKREKNSLKLKVLYKNTIIFIFGVFLLIFGIKDCISDLL